MATLIKNGTIVNNGLSFKGSLLIIGNKISRILIEREFETPELYAQAVTELEHSIPTEQLTQIDAQDLHVLPGIIDDQVHFREPGNTAKATIESESKAAVLGGVTSFMDMPNNNPPAVTWEALENKYSLAAEKSYANYSFYLGATNDNIEEIKQVDKNQICGIKVFMGSSTGNMLVNNPQTLTDIFRFSPVLIATHCEEEQIIQENLSHYKTEYGEHIPFEMHPAIRSRQACIQCSERAIHLAIENHSRLHILHISTVEEIAMIGEAKQINPKISGEVCVHYMWFNKDDYAKYGSQIKCNPAIKEASDMLAIRQGVKEGIIDVVATDHAPHLKEEKNRPYLTAPSGLPLVQHSLQLMLELYKQGIFTIEEVVKKMSHGPAECFDIKQRGYLKEGYFADITLVNLQQPDRLSTLHPAYKCGWSPFEEYTFSSSVIHTFVNGVQVVKNGKLTGLKKSMRLEFDR